jgi:hypothetical protein
MFVRMQKRERTDSHNVLMPPMATTLIARADAPQRH